MIFLRSAWFTVSGCTALWETTGVRCCSGEVTISQDTSHVIRCKMDPSSDRSSLTMYVSRLCQESIGYYIALLEAENYLSNRENA